MVGTAAVVFGLAALGGIAMAALHFSKKPLPLPLAIAHGLAAATGLVLLIIAVATGATATLVVTSLVLFIIAALGGFTLFSFYMRRQPLPSALVVGHALLAVSGFVVLLACLA